ncbi:glycosyltransferase family 9 protein [Enterovibrio makurazakiensis]|uniref:Glycosyltransferase family 9 protein n=1 Tax=Enterovibrio gelatinilyticus TaxID=2899819 RepID=A0ABT5R1H2_9GAMM|nr:glycosyltransferase family 9 protein [Enterovibrio sp. ZSDZ42]MDD1793601.1 glycosyltransferase family 9 protein [Enterovibrio sp. ZSDZ42]
MKFNQPKISSKYACFEKGAYASKAAKHYLNNEFDPNKVKKIAVIRHAALGDQVITRPFLIEARKFFPNAEITLVALSTYQYGMPSDLADRTVVLHGRDRKGEVSFGDKMNNFREVGDQDVIFDLAGTNRSYWVNILNKAKLKIGFPYKSWLKGTLYNAAVFRSDLQPEVETMLDMLRLLGHIPAQRLDFGYPDHAELVSSEQPYFVYFNGASQPRKVLKNDQVIALMEMAVKTFPEVKHVFLEGVNESEKGDFLSHLTTYDNFAIQPCIPLEELLTFCAKAQLVVAPDTGVRNVAISTHTPTVGIFYATVPFRYTPRYEPIHHIVMNASCAVPTNEQIVHTISTAYTAEK